MLNDFFSKYGPREEEGGIGEGWHSSGTRQSNDFVFSIIFYLCDKIRKLLLNKTNRPIIC